MANAIKISSLGKEIQNTLNMYHQDITNQIKVVTKEVANELGKNTKSDAPTRTGDYKKHIAVKKTNETMRGVTYTWYVKNPEHRLSHLIAKGHKLKNGKESKKNDFIEKNEKIAVETYEKRVRGVVEG